MPDTYIVFEDTLNGLTERPQLRGSTLEDTIQLITESRSQCWMYFIYRLHEEKVPLFGTRFDVYRYVKAVAGKKVEPPLTPNKQGLQYAFTHQTSMAWLFADSLFD